MRLKKIAIAVLVIMMPLAGNAGPILQATSVTATTADFGGPFALVNMINQSGLSAGYTSGVTDFDSYVAGTTHNGGGALNSGFSVGPFGQFSFDLGAVLSIDALGFWETQNTGSVLAFDLYADNDQNWGNGVGALIGTFVATANLANAISNSQVFSFGAISTQYLHIDILTTAGGSQPGIGEIAFRAAAVPEPGTLALLGIGLLGMGLARRMKV